MLWSTSRKVSNKKSRIVKPRLRVRSSVLEQLEDRRVLATLAVTTHGRPLTSLTAARWRIITARMESSRSAKQ